MVLVVEVAVLWSGGKESCLACCKAMMQGYEVTCIVTFIGSTSFLCHPLSLMSLQSRALRIPHFKIRVEEPYDKSYREALSGLIKTKGIKGIVTGDVSPIDRTHQNWIENVCKGLPIKVIKPLWGLDPYRILNEVVSNRIRAVFTCVKQPWFGEEWLGRELDKGSLKGLQALNRKYGIDPCGEKGEYHTMVVDAPIFNEAIEISEFGKEKEDSLSFIKINKFLLKQKNWQVK